MGRGLVQWKENECRGGQRSRGQLRSCSGLSTRLVVLLVVMVPSSAMYSTLPADVSVAVGEPAELRCGVSPVLSNLTLMLYGHHGNHSLRCPGGAVEDITQALRGSCTKTDKELLAVWRFSGTSLSDNATRVLCQHLGHSDAPAVLLTVYDNGTYNAIIIGVAIGGFFGILLVIALSYPLAKRSKRLHRCFGGGEPEDDTITIVSKD